MITETDATRIRYYNDNNQKHRSNGPAIEWHDGGYAWCLFGKQHRYYGPQSSFEQYPIQEWRLHGQIIKRDFVK